MLVPCLVYACSRRIEVRTVTGASVLSKISRILAERENQSGMIATMRPPARRWVIAAARWRTAAR